MVLFPIKMHRLLGDGCLSLNFEAACSSSLQEKDANSKFCGGARDASEAMTIGLSAFARRRLRVEICVLLFSVFSYSRSSVRAHLVVSSRPCCVGRWRSLSKCWKVRRSPYQNSTRLMLYRSAGVALTKGQTQLEMPLTLPCSLTRHRLVRQSKGTNFKGQLAWTFDSFPIQSKLPVHYACTKIRTEFFTNIDNIMIK